MENQEPTYSELLYQVSELKKENQQLKQNQQLLQNNADLLVWGTNTAIWEWDYKTGVVKFSDKKAEMLGYKPEELRQDVYAFTEMIHPDDYEHAMENMRNHLTGETDVYEVEYRIKSKNGEYKWFYDKGKVIERDHEGRPLKIVGIVNDITKRNNSIKNLKKSEERFRGLFENSKAGIRIVDSKGIIIEENCTLQEITGYDSSETIGQHIWDIVFKQIPENQRTNEQYSIIKGQINQMLSTGEIPFNKKINYNELTCKDGSIKIVSASYFSVKHDEGYIFYGVIKDETERIKSQEVIKQNNIQLKESDKKLKLALEKEKESKQYLRSIFDQTPILFWEEDFYELKTHLDSLKYQGVNDFSDYFSQNPEEVFVCAKKTKIINVNQAVLDSLKFACKEDLINNFGNTLTDISLQSFKAALISLSEGNHYFESITEHKTSLGELKQFYIKSFVPTQHINNFSRVFVAMLDITELKNTEKELIIAKEKAEESNRLKTAFLRNISHEFRTPMNGILGFSELLIKIDKSDEQREEYAEIVKESCERLLEIVTDTIDISEIQSNIATIKENQCSLSEILQEIIEQLKPKIDKKGLNFIFKTNCNDNQLTIKSDKQKLQRSLKHLIDNAIKFTNSGKIEIICESNNENIWITINDTGIGISKEMQKVIFEPFRQVELDLCRNYGGNGVGLSLVKSYIEMLGGSINLKSEINKGTSVKVTLPLNSTKTTSDEQIETEKKSFIWSEKTILIVEDEEVNYLYLEELLSETGSKLLYARNGQEAVDFCRNNKKIDLILMDLKMPIMNGYEATKLIKEFRAEIPIIAQTAYALEKDIDKIKESGFDDYLTKPFEQEKLIMKIEKHI